MICDISVRPLVFVNVAGQFLPIRIPIPNDPALRGASFGIQTYCRECGIVACWVALTQGVEITIG